MQQDEHITEHARSRSDDDLKVSTSIHGVIDGLVLSSSDNITAPETIAKNRVTTSTPPPQPIGSLSVHSVVGGPVLCGVEVNDLSAGVEAMKLMSKPTINKKVGTAKKSSVRKLSCVDNEVTLDSFEAVERTTIRAQQEETDRVLAVKLNRELNDSSMGFSSDNSSGRVAVIMREEESPASKSLYRSPVAVGVSNNSKSVLRAGNSTGNEYFGTNESHEARSKYANVKSLSSEQFFGQNEGDVAIFRDKLDRYSGSTSISSDMMHGDDNSSGHVGTGNMRSSNLDKLKDSVSGFFDDIQKRIG